MSEAEIVVQGLDMGYGGVILMKDLSFTVNKGDIFVIMGGSGCGKSTLLKIMIGLKEPARGRVFYGATSFWEVEPEVQGRMMRRFGVLYQNGALWTSMTLAENIALPLEQYTNLSRGDIGEKRRQGESKMNGFCFSRAVRLSAMAFLVFSLIGCAGSPSSTYYLLSPASVVRSQKQSVPYLLSLQAPEMPNKSHI